MAPLPPLAQPGLVSLFLFLSSSWREDRKAAAATITCLFFGFSGRCPSQPGPKAALHPHPTHTLHTTIDAAPNIRRRSQERGLLGASSLLLLHHLHTQTLSYNNLYQPLSSTLFTSCSTLSPCSWETEKSGVLLLYSPHVPLRLSVISPLSCQLTSQKSATRTRTGRAWVSSSLLLHTCGTIHTYLTLITHYQRFLYWCQTQTHKIAAHAEKVTERADLLA